MGLMSKAREAAADKHAQEAWDAGSLAYVHRVVSINTTSGKSMTEQIDAVLRVGWQLASTCMTFSSKRVDTEIVLITFIRPKLPVLNYPPPVAR